MEILYKRGDYIFIVKKNGSYYLVNTELGTCKLANPPDKPDMFLKFGYFEQTEEASISVRNKILDIMKRYKV